MIAALLLLLGGLSLIGLVIGARWLDAQHWAGSLRAYRLRFPANLSADHAMRWLAHISATTHPTLWSLLPMPPVCFEVVANYHGITFNLLVNKTDEAKILAGVRAMLPGVRIEEDPDYLAHRPTYLVAAEARITSHVRPLALDRAESSSVALLAALQPVPTGSEIRLSWTLTGAGTPMPVRDANHAGGADVPWWLESNAPVDADDVRAERIKVRNPLLRAVVRIGVVAPDKPQARQLFGRVWPVLHSANAPGVRMVRRWLPSSLVAERMRARALPLGQWPIVANNNELAGLLAMPIGAVHLPGLKLGTARQLPPAVHTASHGAVIGVSNYPGMSGRTVALKTEDRLRHCVVLGPTGSGKSVLLTHMVMQDFARGYGGAVFDPKGDLILDILARLPEQDLDRVVVMDAHDRSRPVGFNILGNVRSEVDRELTTDNVLHIFKSIWADSWGPRTDLILRAGLNTLTLATARDGSPFTICELPALLGNPSFRQWILARANLPDALRDFWHRFEVQSEAERAQAIAPVLNKVDAFVQRAPIALMLGQASNSFDMRSIFTERKLLLVSLAKGALGTETSGLLGSLLVSSLWQATLQRVHVAPERRRAVFAVIDEAQDLLRLPLAIPDVLSQARGLGLSMCLAHQYLSQLPEATKAAVLGTVRTMITFALDRDDAKTLEPRFAPLTAEDLVGMDRYEAAARLCVDGQTLSPCTLLTLPPGAPLRDAATLAAASRERYGTPRGEVEAAMRARLNADATDTGNFGRRWKDSRP